jgi:transcription elongation factor Elf1
MDIFICPKCGKRTLVKKEVESGKYKLICSTCGFQREALPIGDQKQGVT